ncbi:MAG: phosphopantetheine-binding protein [Treponema sp.]|jgi:acyl carrier protein|nr:phosphopantetheine-binding protein [Treponema sp.]
MSRDLVYEKLKEILTKEFEIAPDAVKPDALLMEELDLDSIDAVDLIVQMKQFTTEKIDPALFKNVKTVQDVVDVLFPLVEKVS